MEFNLTNPDEVLSKQSDNKKPFELKDPETLVSSKNEYVFGQGITSLENPNDFKFQTRTESDSNERRAQNQSVADKWGNGAVKMLGTAATSFAEPFVDLTYGVAEALGTGKLSGVYDNDVTKQFDGFSDYLKEQFPNYYTKAEQESGVLEGLTTANFWADKALNGAGFMLGAIGSGMLTGGLGLGARSTGSTKILQGLGKEFSATKKLSDIANLTSKEAELIRKGAAIDQLSASTVGAIGESGMEARQIKNTTRDTLNELRKSGDERYKDLSDNEIEELSGAAGNVGFAINMAVVGSSNFIQFGKLFKNNYSLDKKLLGNATYNIEKGLFEADKISKLGRVAKVLESPITETAQEGLQFTTEKGINDYIKNKYNPSQGLIIKDMFESSLKGLEETFGTKEGLESMLLGALLGGFGSITNKGESTAKNNASIQTAELLNQYKSSESIAPLINSIISHGSYQAAMDDAVIKGDAFNYKNAEFGQFYSYVQSRVASGQYELLVNELDESAKLNKEEFEEKYGVKIPLDKSPQSIVSQLKAQAEKINKISEDVDTRFSIVTPKVRELFKYNLSVVENLKNREKQLSQEVFMASGIDYINLKGINDLETRKNFKENFNKQVELLKEVDIIAYDQVKDKLSDLIEISNRKDQFIESYKELVTIEGQNRAKVKIEKAEKELEEAVKEKKSEEVLDLDKSISNFVGKIKSGDTRELTPEETQFYENNSEEIEKRLKDTTHSEVSNDLEVKKADIERRRQEELEINRLNHPIDHEAYDASDLYMADKITNEKYDAELSTLETSEKPVNNEEGIDETIVNETNVSENVTLLEIKPNGKIAQTPFKTEAGLDDDTKPSRSRLFRWIEKNNILGKRLLIVTKTNNPKLYTQILNSQSNEKDSKGLNPSQFESNYYKKTGKEYPGIYTVIVDDNNNPILVDEQLLFTTLTTLSRITSGDIKASKEDEIKLVKLRADILLSKSPNIYLPVIGKSKGIIQFLPKVGGDRQSKNIVDQGISDSIKDSDATLLTIPALGKADLGILPNKILAKTGKLYIKDLNGNYIDLVPRKLNDDEINMAFVLINQLMRVSPQTVELPKTELEKIMFFGIPKRGVHKNTIAMKGGNLIIGDQTLTKEQFNTEEGRNILASALNDKVVNISREHDLNSAFLAPKTDDSHDSKSFETYKEYLLSGNSPMFGTDITSKSEVQYRNQYLIYTPIIKEDTIKEDVKKEPVQLNTEQEIIETINFEEETKPKEIKSGLGKVIRASKPGRKLDRLVAVSKSSKQLSNEELNWFKTNFPNIPIEKVIGLIEGKSLGRFLSESKVLLSDIATEGTLYHEAFHAVTQLYLTKEEINKLYSEVSILYPNKSRLELEEILAEDFANYKDTGKVLNNRTQRNSIFRKLLNFIKDILNLKANNIEDVYRRLDKGFYKSKSIIGLREFTALDKQIPTLSVKETKDLLDGIDSLFYEILLDDNDKVVGDLYSKPDLVNKILNIIKEELSSNEFINSNWNTIIKSWADRFKSISNEINLGDEFLEDKEDVNSELADSRQGDALQEFNTISTKSLINKETRLLIRGLKQKEYINGELVDKLNSLDLPYPVEFNKTYNLILKNLQGISDIQDQYNKLIELSNTHPELIALIERLGPPSGDLPMNKFIQWMKFRQDFDKNQINSFVTLIEANGNIYTVNAVSQVVYDRVKEEWRNNLKIKAALNKDGELIIPVEVINEKDDIKFLESIGINLSKETIVNTKDNNDFVQSVNQLREYIKENDGNVTELYTDESGIIGRMNVLYQLEGDNTRTVNELSYISAEGKTVYSITQNNALSIIKNIINNSDSIQDLYSKLPHFNTVNMEGSLWLSKLFNKDGRRNKSVSIDLDLHDGVKNKSQKNPKSNSTASLTIGEKYVQEINNILLNGKSSYIRASDKASEFILSLNQYSTKSKLAIPINKLSRGFDIQEVRDIFKGYFKAELKRIALFELKGLGNNIDGYNNNGGKFTIFNEFSIDKKGVLARVQLIDKSLSNEEISSEIDNIYIDFRDNINAGVIKFLNEYSKEIEHKLNGYEINLTQGLSESLRTIPIDNLTKAIAVNDLINTIEQVKLFVGDMAFYKDLFKRTASFTGTKETSATGEEINTFLNNNNKRLDKKQANDDINVVVFDDSKQNATFITEYTNALIDSGVSPQEARAILKPYFNMEEGDAQGWITLDEYREFSIRRGEWNDNLDDIFDKLQKGELLESKELTVFLTLKAQYAGPQEYNGLFVPTYHKFSLLPLIPQLVKNTNLENILNNMTKNQIGYALFKSGSKVGTKVNENGKAVPFYNPNGSLNIDNWNESKQIVSYKFFGLQVKSSLPKSKVIFGTQFRKLLFLDLFENGKSEFNSQYNEYNKIISDLVEKEKSKLINELGVNPNEDYKIEDVRKLVKLLQDEAKSRSLADNIIEALQYEIIDGKNILKYNLDTMVNKDKIDSMIMSLVDSRLIRQKMSGDSLVQASIAGFEKSGIRKDNTLKFYRKDEDGGTLAAECKISMSKDYLPLLEKYKTLDELNRAIKEDTIDLKDKELLKIIGYRIPTQGLNSMEFLKIVEFLPQETNTIILPTELVAKSGGDFDIDKLNIFRKSDGDSQNNRIIELATEILSHKDNFVNLITPNTTMDLKNLANQFDYEDYLNRKRVKGENPVSLEEYITNQEGEAKNIKYTSQLKLTTKTDQFYKFMLAKDMIGIAAIANTHHSLSQQVNASLEDTYPVIVKNKTIRRGVEINFPHNRLENGNISLSDIKDSKNVNKISDIISQIINATVDAAKDPFMFTINMTKDTLGTYLYLIRIGVPFNMVGNFMKQPIITEYLKQININKSSYIKDRKTNNEIINKVEFKFKNELIKSLKIKKSEFNKNKIFFENEDQLSQFLNNDNKKGDLYNQTQLQVLDDFLRYKEQAQLLSDAMRATNIDTAGIGQNLGSVQSKQDLIEKVLNDQFFNGIEEIFASTFIGAMNVNTFVDKIYSPLYYTQSPSIKANTNELVNKIKETLFPFTNEIETKLRTLIENDFINYVIQNYGYNDIRSLQNKLFNLDSVAKRLIEAKKDPQLKDNLLIQELYPLIGQVNKNIDNIKIFAKRYDTYTANLLTESFRELGELDHPNAKQLYKDLMDLGIIQSGLNNSPITYLGLIPYEYYNDLAKRAFEEFNKKNGANDLSGFNQMFTRENSKDSLIWKYAKQLDLYAKGYGMYGKSYSKNLESSKENATFVEDKKPQPVLDKEKTLQDELKESKFITQTHGDLFIKQHFYSEALKFLQPFIKDGLVKIETAKIRVSKGQKIFKVEIINKSDNITPPPSGRYKEQIDDVKRYIIDMFEGEEKDNYLQELAEVDSDKKLGILKNKIC